VPISVRGGRSDHPGRRTSAPDQSDDEVEEQLMAPAESNQSAGTNEEPIVEETLVEEVSIDGMCGVY
jgi:mycofactocin precursor